MKMCGKGEAKLEGTVKRGKKISGEDPAMEESDRVGNPGLREKDYPGKRARHIDHNSDNELWQKGEGFFIKKKAGGKQNSQHPRPTGW